MKALIHLMARTLLPFFFKKSDLLTCSHSLSGNPFPTEALVEIPILCWLSELDVNFYIWNLICHMTYSSIPYSLVPRVKLLPSTHKEYKVSFVLWRSCIRFHLLKNQYWILTWSSMDSLWKVQKGYISWINISLIKPICSGIFTRQCMKGET